MPPTTQMLVDSLARLEDDRFWYHWDFWINAVIGLAGLFYAILAYQEAKQAKRAAVEAGRSVKLQTITIDLSEIAQRLDRMAPEITFSQARDLLTETSRRVRRAISPYGKDADFSDAVTATRQALDAAQKALTSVRPEDAAKESEAPNSVYYGIQSHFATISNCIADLLGLFEMRTVDSGEHDANA